jgi:hypothetical protein
MFRLLSIVVVALLLCARPTAAEFTSYAFVRGDGSLLIRNKVVWLHGVYFPTYRAAGTLDLIRGFVTCQEVGVYDDGSISAICWNRGGDIGANLIRNGQALAGPDAPFEYHAMQRIAESNGLGVWGFNTWGFQVNRTPGFTRQTRPALPARPR